MSISVGGKFLTNDELSFIANSLSARARHCRMVAVQKPSHKMELREKAVKLDKLSELFLLEVGSNVSNTEVE